MKVFDFLYFTRQLARPIAFGFLICFALPAVAKPPSADSFSPAKQLDLTLPDKYIEPNGINDKTRRSNRSLSNLQTDTGATKEPNIGCGMDVTPSEISDASFGNRVVGKCKLSYYY